MATSWKHAGSPIGRKGPRKANPKYKRRAGQPWEKDELKELKALAKGKHPDRCNQPQTATPTSRDTQQGAARGDFPKPIEPLPLQ